MSPSPIDILKNRLASGEISVADYKEILENLKQGGNSDLVAKTKEAAFQVASIAGKSSQQLMDAIFGSNSYQDPTDSQPIEIAGVFSIFGSYFNFDRKRHLISDIKSIGFQANSRSFNYVQTTSTSRLSIKMKNNEEIEVSGLSVFTTGRKNKRLSIAYRILSSRTFSDRFERYIADLQKNNFIQVGKAKLTRDGYVIKGNSRVNLRVSMRKGYLSIGTAWSWGHGTGYVNPYEIMAGETGTGIFSDRIRFTVIDDRDVIFEIIRQMVGIKGL